MTKILDGNATVEPIRNARRVKARTFYISFRPCNGTWTWEDFDTDRAKLVKMVSRLPLALIVRVHCPDMEI